MVQGIFFSQDGEIQQIGNITTLANIIAVIKGVLPELEQKEADRVLQSISDEDLERLIQQRKTRVEKE